LCSTTTQWKKAGNLCWTPAVKKKQSHLKKIFDVCENRIHAIFLFLSLLELVQQKYMMLVTGEGRNNFIIEYNENRQDDSSTPLDLQ
jgi:chromatin segregation and condensation protein Rec8/ScpA/Scc1 (kleisin family)